MFRRRFFYNLTNGTMLRSYSAEGTLNPKYTAEQEAADFSFNNWGVMQWDDYYPDIETAFSEADENGNFRNVRPYVENGELKFEYTPIGTTEATEADYIESLEELGVTFNE